MTPNIHLHRIASPWTLAVALTVGLAITAQARPYATCLTNTGSSISFRLNEPADNVKIISNGGATTNNLGARPKGLVTVSLAISGTFKVQVTKASGPGYPQGVVNPISVDTNTFVQFANQRGVAVNKNPKSPYFGRIYVSCGSAATTGTGRPIGDGIYLLNADQTDAVGQGNTALTGGLNFSASGEVPHRLAVGQDDNLYISDYSDVTGTLYVTDPNVATNAAATNVLDGLGGPFPVTSARIHGSINGAVAEGSLATGDLVVYTIDEDLQTDRDTTVKTELNSLWRWDIGGGPLPYSGTPTKLICPGVLGGYAQLCELRRGPDGKFYISQRRADPASTAGAFVIANDGSAVLWDSYTATQNLLGNPVPAARDMLNESRGIDVSPDGKYMAVFRGTTNTVSVLPLTDGIPDLTNMVVMLTTPTTSIGRALAFDAAGNIYTVSSGQQLLRIYSPGGYATVTTGSDGTLDIYVPVLPAVNVTATRDLASEAGPTPGEYTITRSASDISKPLAVTFDMSGTASNGVDYVLQTNGVALTGNTVVIPAGVSSLDVTLMPINDAVAEFTETAILSLATGADYMVIAPAIATIAIADDETPELTLSAIYASMYERLTNDYVRLQLTRRGDTNVALNLDASAFTCTGAAVSNVDFALIPGLNIAFNPGDVTQDFDFATPIDNSALTGNKTFTIGLRSGSGYVAATNTVPATIVDDELPAETVLFEDKFNTDSSANWKLSFASTNDVPVDYTATFAYDYSALGIPPAPHSSGDTLGLYLTVNKDTTAAAAAVNLYPLNRSFSSDFALRFDMYLIVNNCAYTTEYALFGIDHSGNQTNWFRNNTGGVPDGWTFDGLWYGVEADGAGLGDYVLYSSPTVANNPTALTPGVNASSLTGVFKSPPFAYAGAPANLIGSTTPSWADVEVSQIGSVVTLKIDNTVIMTYDNATPYTSGNVMLGYCDAYDSIGCDAAVIYDNVRVVGLTVPTIRLGSPQLASGGAKVQFLFTAGTGDTPSSFRLQAAASVTGAYADDLAADIVQVSPGVFKATANVVGTGGFYRIRRY
jgi:hypothetical protein